MKKILPLLFATLLLTLFIFPLKSAADSPPGNIRLLSNYKHKFDEFESTDTRIGKIWKEGRLSITYDIGRLAGEWANSKDQDKYVWYKEQIINESLVRIALTKDNQLYVTYPKQEANFYGTVKNQEEIADFLLIALSY